MTQKLVGQLTKEYKYQLNLYQAMMEVARKQVKLCTEADFSEEENIENLNHLLLKRQEQMLKIEKSQSSANTVKEILQRELGINEVNGQTLASLCPYPETENLQKVLKCLNSLLADITHLDTRSQQALQNKLGLVKNELQKIQRSKQAKKAYKPVKKQLEGFFFDKK